jgi:hypothetical protein
MVKPAALTALANVIASLPAHAETGKIFGENRLPATLSSTSAPPAS